MCEKEKEISEQSRAYYDMKNQDSVNSEGFRRIQKMKNINRLTLKNMRN